MGDITLSNAIRNNLLSLQNTAELLGKTQERLATGKKVNSALDNPTNFFTASALQSRSSDISRLLDSVSNGVQTLKAADTGIKGLTDLVENAQATARQALQAPKGEYEYQKAEVTGTVNLGTDVAATVDSTVTLEDRRSVIGTVSLTADTTLASLGFEVGDTIDFSDGTNNITHTVAANETVDDLIATVDGDADFTAGLVNNKLVVQADDAAAANIATTYTPTTAGNTALDNLGIASGASTTQTISNLFDVAGKSFSVSVNDGSTVEFTFGVGPGQVSTYAEMTTRLGAMEGISATDTAGVLTLASDTTSDKFRLGGDEDVLASIGFEKKTYSASNTAIDDLEGRQIEISVGTSSKKITFGKDAGVGQVNSVAELKKALSEIGAELAQDTTTGMISITTSDAKQSKNIEISGDTYALAGLGLKEGVAESSVTAIVSENSTRASLENDFNDLLKQIDALARDASYNGVNLLDGDDLTVIFNEDGSSKLDITGVRFDAEGLGLETLTPNDFQDDNKIEEALSKIDSALGTLRSQASRFGSQLSVVETRQDFSKELVNVLETGAANLTLADTNEEAANVLALQTRQQLSTSALSLTSQAEQGILRLF